MELLRSSRCDDLASPNIPNFVLSLLILIGILVSYLPQHHRIISRRSSEGLSPYFILLGTTSATCAIANILVLPTSRADVACCKDLSPFACTAGLLGIAQIGAQWSCFTLIMLLFLVFFPKASSEVTELESGFDPAKPTWRTALIVVFISIAHLFLVLIVSVVLLARFPDSLQLWADILGICSTVLAAIQYLPQIWTTWQLQHVYSLSIPMMCIQTPGSYVFAASLAIRLGWSGWSAWGVYIVTGLLQGCLLVMAIMFEIRDRRQQKLDEGDDGAGGRSTSTMNGHHRSDDERRPLLS